MGISIYPVPALRKCPPPGFARSFLAGFWTELEMRNPMHLRELVCKFCRRGARKEVSGIFTISSEGMSVAMVSSVMLSIFLLHLYLPCIITLESRRSSCLVQFFSVLQCTSVLRQGPLTLEHYLAEWDILGAFKLNFKRA